MSSLNDPSFFRKGGMEVGPRSARTHTEVGRDPLTGNWYIQIKTIRGVERAILRPDQAFSLFKGGLMAMARFQPERIGEIRSLFEALVPHVG
jgi:hypothetical protein